MQEVVKTISRNQTGLEHQGTKYKYWFDDGLFKVGKVAGENWAEVVSYQLSLLLKIPAAEYIFAEFKIEQEDGIKGTYSKNFILPGQTLINANELLNKKSNGEYDPYVKYHHHNYTFQRAMSLMKVLSLSHSPVENYNPNKQIIGYFLFDVLIANQDRHHENWGFISCPINGFYLAPTYDHGSSLACRMPIDEREKRLASKDLGYQVATFAKKAKSAFHYEGKSLKTYKLAELCVQRFPVESQDWIKQIKSLSAEDFRSMLEFIPDNRMSDIEKEFTLSLLQTNQQYLSGLLKNV